LVPLTLGNTIAGAIGGAGGARCVGLVASEFLAGQPVD